MDADKTPAAADNRKNFLARMMSINFNMLPVKLTYMLYGGNLGSHIAFLNVFFTSVGLTTSQAGFITGIRFVSASIAQPIWGYLSDYTGRRKLVLVVLCLGAALPMFSTPWVSKWIYPRSQYEHCHGNVTLGNTTYELAPGNPGYSDTIRSCRIQEEKDRRTLFYALLAIVTFASAFLVPLPGYVDTIAMNMVKTSSQKATYGGQRIFGSVGFSLANFLAGTAADTYRHKDMSNYTAAFYLFLPYTLSLIPTGCYLIAHSDYSGNNGEEKDEKKEAEATTDQQNLTKQVFALLGRFDVAFFMGTVLICGLANNLFMSFAYMLVRDEFAGHKSQAEMTLVVIVAAMSETLVFPFTSKIIKLLGGNTPAIILGMFSYFVRFIIMSLGVPFGVLVAVQCLHSVGFALAFSAMMEYMHTITPRQIYVTMNSFMLTLFFSVSSLLANMLGGSMYQHYGGKKLFLGKAIVCGVWTLLMVMYHGGKKLRAKYIQNAGCSVKYEFSDGGCKEKKEKEMVRGIGIENPIACLDDEFQDVVVEK